MSEDGKRASNGYTIESKNMNYIFHVEYFKNIYSWKTERVKNREHIQEINCYNDLIKTFIFEVPSPAEAWKEIDGYQSFALSTCYPGLLIGTGNPHDISMESAIKCGFSFDSVTGLPYIPGSSIKGMLRSYFPGDKEQESAKEYEKYICSLIDAIQEMKKKHFNIDVHALEADIFDHNDIFLGAFPCNYHDSSMLDMEFITPHNKGKFANPIPISLLKVKPGISFEFGFCLNDYEENGNLFSASDKLELFKRLILDMGIGAKTNVGFGKFREE